MSSTIKDVADQLFQGKDQCLVPKRSGGNIYMDEIVGAMIGYSILHCGPPLNVLALWVYKIISGNSVHYGYIKLYQVTRTKTT